MCTWCNFWQVSGVYRQTLRNREGSLKNYSFQKWQCQKERKSKGFYWSYQLNRLFYSQIDTCQCNFEGIKTYLLNPPTCTFSAGHPLLMYLVIHETSMGCVLARMTKQVRRSKQSITSARIHRLRVLLFCPIENVLCFCVGHIEIMPLFVVRYYIVDFPKWIYSSTYSKKPMLSERLARWNLLLAEFDITYVT